MALNRMFGGTTNEEAVKEALETLNAKLDVYEKILSTQKYMAGDVRILVTLRLNIFRLFICTPFSHRTTPSPTSTIFRMLTCSGSLR